MLKFLKTSIETDRKTKEAKTKALKKWFVKHQCPSKSIFFFFSFKVTLIFDLDR